MSDGRSDGVVAGDGHVDIVVWSVPSAARSEIVGWHGDAIRIRVTQPPERGKANEAIGALLAERLGVSVALVSGAASRRKRFRVRGLSAGDVADRLGV